MSDFETKAYILKMFKSIPYFVSLEHKDVSKLPISSRRNIERDLSSMDSCLTQPFLIQHQHHFLEQDLEVLQFSNPF